MNKYRFALLLIFFPMLAFADNALSFTPPASDYSVVFLGNLFGIVDGVLHGTGSQIMGSLFSVFNAAVLALGGIVITYTLLVSTMNTAHEGQMLGQKWSSIWIPARSVMGLTLLIPKASGYCLMQIFVMWVIVQGVGAADKVWDAALSYLNRGGAIIQVQQDPTKAFFSTGGGQIASGAQAILAGQVCMLGLQTQLQNQLQTYKSLQSKNTGPCYGAPSETVQAFCKSTVPDFLATVDVVSVQDKNPQATGAYTVQMPNFISGNFAKLNGICGSISWNPLDASTVSNIQKVGDLGNADTKGSDLYTAKLSRAIAIQQMYSDLSSVAQFIVRNDPSITSSTSSTNSQKPYSDNAIDQFGIPLVDTNTPCASSSDTNCLLWGPLPSNTGATLLNGTEFPGAIQDYNGIMLPTLTLVQQAKNAESNKQGREFIEGASQQGWMMAGSYFYNLANLNKEAAAVDANLVDTDSGLENSVFSSQTLRNIMAPFSTSAGCADGTYVDLCIWLNNQKPIVQAVVNLIQGANPVLDAPKLSKGMSGSIDLIQSGSNSSNASTVFGYTNNSSILKLPGEPGQNPLKFAKLVPFKADDISYTLPEIDFGCGGLKTFVFFTCLGGMLGDIFYNDMARIVLNAILVSVNLVVNQLLQLLLYIPIQAMETLFISGLSLISAPGVNPIVALAKMGTWYINMSINLWIDTLTVELAAFAIPVFGIVVFLVMGMVMPLLLSWLGVMVAIGFSTAYYVPILPYMIFTFGSIAWLMAVIEAMVAAPIVALGVTHPEGHDAFGKGEGAIMILMNVFLRPSLMIIGYIAAIALSYVSVWIINAGFDNAISFMQNDSDVYASWASVYGFFFSILIYTTMYMTVVTKAFSLIAVLPDKVLRWIGGNPESAGQDAAGWAEDTKGQIKEGGEQSQKGTAAMNKKLLGGASDGIKKAMSSGGSSVKGHGDE